MHLSSETSRTIATRKATLFFRKKYTVISLVMAGLLSGDGDGFPCQTFTMLSSQRTLLSFSQAFFGCVADGVLKLPCMYAVVALCMILK